MVVEDINTYVTPVYPHEEHFRYAVKGPGLARGYEFAERKSAASSRSMLIKQLKIEGLNVIQVRGHC